MNAGLEWSVRAPLNAGTEPLADIFHGIRGRPGQGDDDHDNGLGSWLVESIRLHIRSDGRPVRCECTGQLNDADRHRCRQTRDYQFVSNSSRDLQSGPDTASDGC